MSAKHTALRRVSRRELFYLPLVTAIPALAQRRTADTLVATLATRAGMLVMPQTEQQAALGRIRALLASRPETADGEFTLPMLTCVLRSGQRGT